MKLFVDNVKWLMLVSGLLTMTMIYAAIAPQAALSSMFGDALQGPVAEIVVRNWGVLVALVGAMLVHGAFNPPVRPLVLGVALASKLAFVLLVLWQGGGYPARAGLAIAVDCVWIVVFALCLAGQRRSAG